ncbi:hypothetical protein LCGC14_0071370 [marine sediment metagenome]|uniref:Uncharacterized protein n=1 Tax=marine sediment metagenome TaxID=412755 RepID=A0A0F9YNA7_9ZZZZ|nr:hypothetical protein [Maribacter sp.]HDZ05487.1 hypothetical protein [Maribacter sp.]HEA78927.1 hypothetical protein [Maribacter sp.]
MLRYSLLLPFILSYFSTMVYGQANDINTTTIECDENGCKGRYYGPEFINGSDVAHQFSNTMSHKVGDKLKECYNSGVYTKVDFSSIKMTTLGMGSGMVTYKLRIPFLSVTERCDAFTSFDHVGGWNHTPSVSTRKKELSNVLLPGDTLHISDLKTTPEGLQEYWIQWRNKATQANCN